MFECMHKIDSCYYLIYIWRFLYSLKRDLTVRCRALVYLHVIIPLFTIVLEPPYGGPGRLSSGTFAIQLMTLGF
jgi:hypothetical protein